MHTHKEQQEGRVELNIGGYHFQTSVQTLRHIPHTFFDASFSGRYAQDVCDDGSIFVDRDGEHFGHVLEYMRDGVVSVAAPGACPSVSLLRALKREFGYYCIELVAEEPAEPAQQEMVFVMGGTGDDGESMMSMERYDVASGQWSMVAAMGTARHSFGTCVIAGEPYVTGGRGVIAGEPYVILGRGADDVDYGELWSVEKYTLSTDTSSTIAPMPEEFSYHAAVAVGTAMYVLGYGESTFKFDSTQGTWSAVAPLPESRMFAAACAIGSDIHIFGGRDVDDDTQASIFKYDTVADEWSILEPMPLACEEHKVSVVGGLVYIMMAGNGCDVLRFDPASGEWSTLATLMNDQKEAVLFVVGGCLYIAGGTTLRDSVQRYNVASATWTDVENMLEIRRSSCAVTIESAACWPGEEDLFESLITRASNR
jgi:hypothetical protein